MIEPTTDGKLYNVIDLRYIIDGLYSEFLAQGGSRLDEWLFQNPYHLAFTVRQTRPVKIGAIHSAAGIQF